MVLLHIQLLQFLLCQLLVIQFNLLISQQQIINFILLHFPQTYKLQNQ